MKTSGMATCAQALAMALLTAGLVGPAVPDARAADASPAIVVDAFADAQALAATTGTPADASVTSSAVWGGSRQVQLRVRQGEGETQASIDAGRLTFESAAGVNADLLVIWRAPESPGGVANLSAAGGSFDLTLFEATEGTRLALEAVSGAGRSTAALTLPLITAERTLNVAFSAFTPQGGSGANFTQITELRLRVTGQSRLVTGALAVIAASSTPGAPPPPPVVSPGGPQKSAVLAPLGGDVDGDTRVDPGDTLRYTITIPSGGTPSTGVVLTDTIDAQTTLVGGTLHVFPLAINDGPYNAVGNTLLFVGPGTQPAAPVAVASIVSLLANDKHFNGTNALVSPPTGPTTITGFTATSANGGTVSVAADGSFTYLPAAGFVGNDSFTYTITDSRGGSDIATVSITVANRVWYVDSAAGAGGDGRSSTPFDALSDVTGATGPDATSDTIYVRERAGDYDGNMTLLNTQQLLGSGVNLVVGGYTLVPASANTTLVTTAPATNSVTVAQNNTVRGFTIGNTTGAKLAGTTVGSTPGLTVNTLTMAGSGPAVNLNGSGTLAVTIDSLSTTSSVNAILISGMGGSFTASAGAISGATGADVTGTGGTANITYTGSITNTGGQSVNFSSRTGGTVAFNGAINDTGTGISLTGNGGSTFSFRGGLIMSTGTSAAFAATGGGTIEVCDENPCNNAATGALVNTLTTTTGTALNVANTNIGANNLEFRSISANGGTNGVVLNNTGASGGLKVKGNSSGNCGGSITVQPLGTPSTANAPAIADCTGGTIQATSGPGILLTNTANVSLTRMLVQNSGADEISIQTINGLTIDRCYITDASGVAGDRGIEIGDFSTGTAVNGAITISNSTIGPTPHDNVAVGIGSGTSTWNISSTVFTGSQLNSGFNFEIRNATMSSFLMNGSVVQSQFADGMQMQPASGVNASITSATIQNSTFVGNNLHIDLNHDGTSNVTYRVLNNTFRTSAAQAINFFTSATPGTGGTMNGRFEGNRIGDVAIASSGGGGGIRVNVNGGAVTRVLLNGNVIRQMPNGRGIEIISRNGTGGTDATVTNNNVDTNFVTTPENGGFSLSNIFLQSNCLTTCNTLRSDVRSNVVPATPPNGELVAGQLVLIRSAGSTNQLVDNAPGSADAVSELASHNTGSVATSGLITLIAGPINTPP
jgi:uncharacterized repeat protein (TIGR01451 family)